MSLASQADVLLRRSFFGDAEQVLLAYAGLSASLFRYRTGIDAVRLSNGRGHVVVLPYMGQIVWDAVFDGVKLGMHSMFREPRSATTIVDTYGALMYHAGLLRNGVPTAEDTHALHGEFPVAPMTAAGLACGTDERGAWIAVTGNYEHAVGFGAHYVATPRVVLRAEPTFDIVMAVENLSAKPMDLMYLCHVNFAFVKDGRIVQPVAFTPDNIVTRTAVPSFVTPTEAFRTFLNAVAADPARLEVLREPERYDPEQVCYIKNLKPGADGRVQFAMLRPEGDAFSIAYDPVALPHTIRWIFDSGDQSVAAFAMPGTCEPEGYTAETRKGNVRSLAAGTRETFTTTLSYFDKSTAAKQVSEIENNKVGS